MSRVRAIRDVAFTGLHRTRTVRLRQCNLIERMFARLKDSDASQHAITPERKF
jgi:hypothetical protein